MGSRIDEAVSKSTNGPGAGNGDNGIRVFFYHGVVESRKDSVLERNFHSLEQFRAQMALLRHCRVLSLDELAGRISAQSKNRRPGAVITFDDGHANNLIAAEVLEDLKLPWSLFVSTGALGRGNMIWTEEVALLLLHGRAERIEMPDRFWQLTGRRERELAFRAILARLKAMASDERGDAMESIRGQFPDGEKAPLLKKFPSLKMLSWDGVRGLKRRGVEIASHGVYHEIHHFRQHRDICRRELTESKASLESELGVRCRFFAFPDGKTNPFSPEDVRRAGYELGFTTGPGTIDGHQNRFLLPRTVPGRSLSGPAKVLFGERE